MTQDRIIREATMADVACIMRVIEAAKGIMRASGNMFQWINGYPSAEVIEKDIRKHVGYVVTDNGEVVAYYAFIPSPEPTYDKIYGGDWIEDALPYYVIHRIASGPDVHGIFGAIMEYAFAVCGNIRIDTHRDNAIMQHCLQNWGFTYCGIILLANGDERLAYQRVTVVREVDGDG